MLTVVGAASLLTVGRWLTPARIKPDEDLTEEFDLLPEVEVDESELEVANERQNLVEVVVAPGAQLLGSSSPQPHCPLLPCWG